MPETDALPISRGECAANINSMKIDIANIKEDVAYNKSTHDKLMKIILGNGSSGLVEKVNILMMRNQWIDRGFSIVLSIFSTLITLWITGWLHL